GLFGLCEWAREDVRSGSGRSCCQSGTARRCENDQGGKQCRKRHSDRLPASIPHYGIPLSEVGAGVDPLRPCDSPGTRPEKAMDRGGTTWVYAGPRPRSALDLGQPRRADQGRHLVAMADAELAEDVVDVVLHGRLLDR